jgi:hypothetical protein
MAESTQVFLPVRAAIRKLNDAGLIKLDDANLDRLRQECWDGSEEEMEDAGVLGVITAFYNGNEAAMKDGFLWHPTEFWQETEDLIGELGAILKISPPLFRQIKVRSHLKRRTIEVERDDGQRTTVEAESMGDVVDLFNEELKARKRPERLIELDTSGEWEMVVALELSRAKKLFAEGALPVDAGFF